MEQKSKDYSLKVILITIAIGIWTIVLQNSGVVPTSQNVNVVNTVDTHVRAGNINADVNGTVSVDNTVNMYGTVSVDNTVDVNIEQILGAPAAAFGAYTNKYGREHYALGVQGK